ncbi:MAG: tetratricopeptide repeat protein [Actinobacteria bacterium]|nr:MAG: tetratricopeptide repeat protein [Actinomycetota bacterium]TMM26554.1 MAG: tetratricopeptide repeat protein [Actinomycetota bacterium]
MSDGYEVAHIDELEELPINNGEFVWRPVRRRFGITAFGTNAYTGDAGQRVIEEHSERDNHQEMYVVVRGRATFTLGDDEIDAPAGTIVFVRPGTKRGAIAAEDRTAVLAVGAKPGVVFEPSPWEDIFVANSYAETGNLEGARGLMAQALEQHPEAWQGFFNAACLEARLGDRERALEHFERAVELEPEKAREFAKTDSDFDSIRDNPRFSSLVAGQAGSGGELA